MARISAFICSTWRAFEPGQRRVAQDLVAQVLGFLAAVQNQRLVDDVADVFAQGLQRRGEPLGLRGIGCRQRVKVVAQQFDAELLEDPQ